MHHYSMQNPFEFINIWRKFYAMADAIFSSLSNIDRKFFIPSHHSFRHHKTNTKCVSCEVVANKPITLQCFAFVKCEHRLLVRGYFKYTSRSYFSLLFICSGKWHQNNLFPALLDIQRYYCKFSVNFIRLGSEPFRKFNPMFYKSMI